MEIEIILEVGAGGEGVYGKRWVRAAKREGMNGGLDLKLSLCPCFLGPRLHHQLPEEGDALRVREGQQEEGAGEQPGRDLWPDPAGAPDLAWRLSQPEEDAGNQGLGLQDKGQCHMSWLSSLSMEEATQGGSPRSVLPAGLSLAQHVSYLGLGRNREPQ